MRRFLLPIVLASCGGTISPVAAPTKTAASDAPTDVPVAPVARELDGPPCFPDQAVISALELYEQTRPYAVAWGEKAGQGGEVGTCTVDVHGDIWSADTQVGRVHCGLDVMVPGIVDPNGLGVGVSGQDVLDHHSAARVAELTCMPDWEQGPAGPRAHCWLPDPHADSAGYDETGWGYVVDGEAWDRCRLDDPAQCDEPVVRGARALEFFAARQVVQLQYRGWCH
jgi:hypothetical protein